MKNLKNANNKKHDANDHNYDTTCFRNNTHHLVHQTNLYNKKKINFEFLKKYSRKKLYSRAGIAIIFIMSTFVLSTLTVNQGQAFSLKKIFNAPPTDENNIHTQNSDTPQLSENSSSSAMTTRKNESLNTSQTLNASPTTYKIYYYLQDHLGNVTNVLDEHGNLLEVKDYLPFGGTNVDETYGDDKSDYAYNDKEKDPEADLYYYGARYYNDSI